jgi:adenylate kinase
MENTNAKTVFLFGRPGSGKGTQAKLLAEKAGWSVFSTGDKFKEMRDASGAIADRVREAYDAGKLIPDWFASYLFEETVLNLGPGSGVVCEGFPRSLPQAQLAHDVLSWLSRSYVVMHLAVPEEDALARMLERAKVEHRPDSDDEAKIRARFDTYRTQTEPVLAFFKEKGMLVEVDGTPDVPTIHKDILSRLQLA